MVIRVITIKQEEKLLISGTHLNIKGQILFFSV
jgi:hypothetical protein